MSTSFYQAQTKQLLAEAVRLRARIVLLEAQLVDYDGAETDNGILLRRAEAAEDRIATLEAALRLLIRGYVNTLEGARDIILRLGGDCDDVPTMEAADPALRHAKAVLAPKEPPHDG